ncbi:MAG TPA: DUF1059 domain-containing protein [Candidatus Angelobacter sp.]
MANPNQPDQPKGVQSSQSSGQGQYSFRCADMGNTSCSWEARGSSQDEVLRKAEQHGREKHNITSMDEATRNKVRSNIRAA